MKKYFKIIIVSLMLCMFFSTVAFAEEDDITVRVRIKGRTFNEQAELDGYENITIYDTSSVIPKKIYQTDDELSILMDTYYDQFYNELSSITYAKIGPYHVKLSNKYFNSFEEAQNEINKLISTIPTLGSGFYPYFNGQDYQICYGAFVDSNSALTFVNTLKENGIESTELQTQKQSVLVYDGQNNIVFMYKNNYNIAFTSFNSDLGSEMIKIDSKPYRGMMAFNIINNADLISINKVDVESYLYGVVPCESPSSWPLDALKAQTLAARTYAVANLKRYNLYGYDLNDDVSSQVYGGFLSEKNSTNIAVETTKGEMIYYNGKLIDAVFHSTSGGSTENSENVWQYEIPYLRGVDDTYSNISPRTVWQKIYTKDQLIARLRLYDYDVNEIYDVKITKVTENNRAYECIFYTDKGEITIYKDLIRSVLGVDSLWLTVKNNTEGNDSFYFASLKTTEFASRSNDSIDITTTVTDGLTNKYIISNKGKTQITGNNVAFISSSGITNKDITTVNSNQYVIDGRGWGHSLGMSQYGAKQMATEGFKYDEIIKHYYTGVTIQ
ncbi:MAG: SpoIID/LytB protein [Bacillota bacterium]|nr:SpoIID/LytB protein [Bacillota bacterium]